MSPNSRQPAQLAVSGRATRRMGEFGHPGEPALGDVGQSCGGGLHRGIVALRRLDARGVEGAAVGPGGDVRLGAVACARRRFRGPASAPSRPGCRGACSAGTAGCAPGRRRGSPPRSRRAPRRSTGSRRGSSGAGSCPAPRAEPAAGTAARRRRSAPRASPARSGTDSVVEDDLAAGHVLDVAEADDVLDGAEQIELPRAEGRCLGHRGHDVACRSGASRRRLRGAGRDRRATRRRRPRPWCPRPARAPPPDRAGRRRG